MLNLLCLKNSRSCCFLRLGTPTLTNICDQVKFVCFFFIWLPSASPCCLSMLRQVNIPFVLSQLFCGVLFVWQYYLCSLILKINVEDRDTLSLQKEFKEILKIMPQFFIFFLEFSHSEVTKGWLFFSRLFCISNFFSFPPSFPPSHKYLWR